MGMLPHHELSRERIQIPAVPHESFLYTGLAQ